MLICIFTLYHEGLWFFFLFSLPSLNKGCNNSTIWRGQCLKAKFLKVKDVVDSNVEFSNPIPEVV